MNFALFKKNFIFLILLLPLSAQAQFPGIPGTPGSTAIHKDSSIFVAWAQTCDVYRGYQDIADTTLGYTSTGSSTMALGQADGVQVVSLGDGGWALLTFENPINNGPGFDFAVFENGFIDGFLELAFVEVSSDGIHFYRFNAISNTPVDVQMGPFDYNSDATLLHNLAGKYRVMYGTPFDLDELHGAVGLNIDSVTYIKIIDVVGSINPLYARYDSNNHIINDPYPTAFSQGGFDLDAVGVIHQKPASIKNNEHVQLKIFPNPFTDRLHINTGDKKVKTLELYNIEGSLSYSYNDVFSEHISLNNLAEGIYFLKVNFEDGNSVFQKVLKLKHD